MVHSKHPVLNWGEREDSEFWIESEEGGSRQDLGH